MERTLWVAVRKSHQPLAPSGRIAYAVAADAFTLKGLKVSIS